MMHFMVQLQLPQVVRLILVQLDHTQFYIVTDKDGNTATATRTVNVVDTTPVVTVTGDNPVTTELGATYTDAGATATDASGTVEVVTQELLIHHSRRIYINIHSNRCFRKR